MSAAIPITFPNGLPSGLLSDMDGLLLDTEHLSLLVFNEMAEKHAIPNGDEIFPQLIGRSKTAHQEIFARNLPSGIDPIAFDEEWKSRFLERLEHGVPVKDGVPAFLTQCHELGISMMVVTSTNTAKAKMLLERAGLLSFFKGVIGGDQVTASKPHPEIYQRGAAALSCVPSACLALEDSNNGARSAYDAGAKVIQIPDLAPASADILALGIPQLKKITDIPAYLDWPA